MLFRKLSFLVVSVYLLHYNLAYGRVIISNAIPTKQYFTGREAVLEKLKKAFNNGENIVSVVGISGIGKTELVRKFVELNQDNYKIIWTIDINRDLRYQFQELAVSLNKVCIDNNKPCINEDLDKVIANVMHYLDHQKDWLLIFDNLQISQNMLINKIIEKEYSTGKFIIISQDKEGLSNNISLSEMSSSESKQLINKIATQLPDETKKQIRQEFLGYPLPIVTTVKFLEQNIYISFEEYRNLKNSNTSNEKLRNLIKNIYQTLNKEERSLLIKCSLLDHYHLSKSLLIKIKSDKLISSIYKLNKVSLILIIETQLHNPKNAIFEMHDQIKKAILSIIEDKDIKDELREAIQVINSIFPPDVSLYSDVTKEYPYLTENMEKLLINAQQYNAPLLDIMELRKNLLILYTHKLDYKNAQRMLDWFNEQKELSLLEESMEIRYKEAYAWYYIYQGVLLDFANKSVQESILSFERAIAIVSDLPIGSFDLRFTAHAQLAQTLVYAGDVDKSQRTLKIAEDNIKNLGEAGDWGLLNFLKAKILLEQGQYSEGLIEIDKGIEFEKKFQDETFTAPAKLLKAEILVRQNEADKAKNISTEVFNLSLTEFNNDHEFKARTLMIHGLVKLHLKQFKSAHDYIQQAKRIFINLPRNQNIEFARIDDDLAQTLVLEGELESFEGNYVEAIEFYKQGKEILENRYGANLKNDRYSLLLYKLIIAYVKSNQFDKAHLYVELHNDIFSMNHYRAKDIYTTINTS